MSTGQFFAYESELPIGTRLIRDLGDSSVLVLHESGGWFALDGVCPHKQGPLVEGLLEGDRIRCPWHGMEFSLRDGRCAQSPTLSVATHQVILEEGKVWVTLRPKQSFPRLPSLLARVGSRGDVGRYQLAESALKPDRGATVLVKTERGLELGEVLAFQESDAPISGRFERHLENSELMGIDKLRREAVRLTDQACAAIGGDCAVSVVDGELLFDHSTLILYFLGVADDSLGPLSVRLGELLNVPVQFEPWEPPQGCSQCQSPGGCHQ